MEMMKFDIEVLTKRAQMGDREAFGELFKRFEGCVFAVARVRERDPHEVQDLVQEVFMHAMQKIGQLREPACFGAWLQKITVRVAINRRIRRPAMQTMSSDYEQADEAVESPLEDLMKRERRDQIRSAVSRLRPIDRDALVAFYLKGKPLSQIAEEFEVPVGTVKRRLHVARRRLEQALAKKRARRPRAKSRNSAAKVGGESGNLSTVGAMGRPAHDRLRLAQIGRAHV